MLKAGAFDGVTRTRETPDLLYVHATGGRKPFEPLAVKPPRGDPRTLDAIVEEHERRFRGLVGPLHGGGGGLCLTTLPEICQVLRRLRPSRPRAGMVAGGGGEG